MIALPIVIFDSKIRQFLRRTSAPMDNHVVPVPRRNEENVPRLFQSMLIAMLLLDIISNRS